VKSKTMRASSIGVAVATLMIGFILLPAQRTAAQAPELRVLSSDGMEPALRDLNPRIESTIGRRLKSQFDSSKNLVDKIQAGVGFDVAILTTGTIDDLIKQGKIAAASRVEIASTGIGVGIRKGASKPDISTPEAMKRTLLKAKFISFNSTGVTVLVINKMFERLGIAEEVKPKLMSDPVSGAAQRFVAEGKAEIVLILIPEVKGFPGVDYIGPLPGDMQSKIYSAAGVAVNSRDPEKAKALVSFIASPAAVPTLKAKGMEPH
jgi:molybdate transport system substrate-binding protein